jgi:lysyl-tRNA synthetase class 2
MNKIDLLRDRAAMLARARAFFADRHILEVDCPILSKRACVDAHIDLIPATYAQRDVCYMHSSPEYGMKRLIAQGMGDIYQLSHVFRDGESGRKHNPEFMMAEWYRIGIPFEALIEETLDFIRVFLGDLPHTVISYREALKQYAGIDYVTATREDLIHYMHEKNIAPSSLEEEDHDSLLNYILGIVVEPQLGNGELCALAYYPSTQAALAQTRQKGDEKVAERFEVYFQGMELCNGYHELADAVEQRRRFEDSNQMRLSLGKAALPIDDYFLEALSNGFPDCCGVAVGVDRLMMLRHKQNEIGNVIPFRWDLA